MNDEPTEQSHEEIPENVYTPEDLEVIAKFALGAKVSIVCNDDEKRDYIIVNPLLPNEEFLAKKYIGDDAMRHVRIGKAMQIRVLSSTQVEVTSRSNKKYVIILEESADFEGVKKEESTGIIDRIKQILGIRT